MNSRLCLFSLVLFCGTAQPVRTADEWGRRRSGIRRDMHEDETDLSNRQKIPTHVNSGHERAN